MKKRIVITLLLLISLLLLNLVSAESISEDLHLNIQTTYSNGTIQPGTFAFVFNISTSSNCSDTSTIIYSNSTTLTTDSRGIISYYLPNVSLNYSDQYYLCYYRDGSLKDSTKIARTPYTFRARNITLSGVEPDANLNLGGYNVTASYFIGNGSYLVEVNDTLVQLNCANEQVVKWNSTSSAWYCSDVSAAGAGDIDAVNTPDKYLTGGQTSGTVNLLVNETELNTTIDSRITLNNISIVNWITSTFVQIANIVNLVGNWSADKSNYYNTTQVDEINTSMKNYVDSISNNDSDYLDGYNSSFFMPLNNSVYGQFDFNGGWQSDGLSIIGGNIFAQMGYFYNISSLVVSNLNINGSLYPVEGFDNQFDIGSLVLRWRDINIGGELHSNGTGDNYFLGNVGIGTGTPQNELNVVGDANITGDVYGGDYINATTDVCIEGGNCLSNVVAGSETDPYWTGNQTNVAFTNIHETFTENVTFVKNISVDGNVLYVDSNNDRVGIGTATPLSKLSVGGSGNSNYGIYGSGDTGVYGSGSFGVYGYGASYGVYGIGATGVYGSGSFYGVYGTGATGVYAEGDTYDFYAANASGKSYFAGNVGIGTTNPDTKLHIEDLDDGVSDHLALQLENNDVRAGLELETPAVTDIGQAIFNIGVNTNRGILNKTGVSDTGAWFRIDTRPSYEGFHWFWEANGTDTESELMTINGTSGNVGVGTVDPQSKLHIHDTWDTKFINGNQIDFTRDGTNYITASNASGDLSFGTGGRTTDVTINALGNVGIGTTAPAHKLTIAGDVNITGTNIMYYGTAGQQYYNGTCMIIKGPTSTLEMC